MCILYSRWGYSFLQRHLRHKHTKTVSVTHEFTNQTTITLKLDSTAVSQRAPGGPRALAWDYAVGHMRGKDLFVVCTEHAEEKGGGEKGGVSLLGRGFPLISSLHRRRAKRERGRSVFGCVGMLLSSAKRGISVPLRHFCTVSFFVFVLLPRTGWGSSLCCWLGWDTARYGDDCASYCLASAGASTPAEGERERKKAQLPALLDGFSR